MLWQTSGAWAWMNNFPVGIKAQNKQYIFFKNESYPRIPTEFGGSSTLHSALRIQHYKKKAPKGLFSYSPTALLVSMV